MSRYKIVLIDLDGTLTDSSPGIFNAVRYGLNRIGHPIPPEETLIKFIGPPLIESFAVHCNLTGERAEQALDAYREYYREKGLFENAVYDGIPEALERLKGAGLMLALATSKPEEFSVRIMERFGLDKYFDTMAGASLDVTRATKQKVIEYALKLLKVSDPSEAIMVGDRHHDVEGAAVHGIRCIGVTYGYGSAEELLGAGAMCVAATPAEVADIILGS